MLSDLKLTVSEYLFCFTYSDYGFFVHRNQMMDYPNTIL